MQDLRCRCSLVIFGQFRGASWTLGSCLLPAPATIRPRQHVLKHAFRLSTLLFDLWQIDSEAAAGGEGGGGEGMCVCGGGGVSEHVVDLSCPDPDVKTELMSAARHHTAR